MPSGGADSTELSTAARAASAADPAARAPGGGPGRGCQSPEGQGRGPQEGTQRLSRPRLAWRRRGRGSATTRGEAAASLSPTPSRVPSALPSPVAVAAAAAAAAAAAELLQPGRRKLHVPHPPGSLQAGHCEPGTRWVPSVRGCVLLTSLALRFRSASPARPFPHPGARLSAGTPARGARHCGGCSPATRSPWGRRDAVAWQPARRRRRRRASFPVLDQRAGRLIPRPALPTGRRACRSLRLGLGKPASPPEACRFEAAFLGRDLMCCRQECPCLPLNVM